MILSYRDERAKDFAKGRRVKAFSGLERPSRLKLDRLKAATSIMDLAALPVIRITGILNGQRAITGDTALRLGHFFGTSPEFRLNLQSLYELRLAEQKAGKSIRVLPTLKKHASTQL